MKFSRRGFLKACAALPFATMLPSIVHAQGQRAKRLIVVRAFGGWDVTYCMDPRLTSSTIDGPDYDNPGGGADEIANYGDLPIMVNPNNRPAADAFFSRFAANTLVVNGIYTGSIVHDECQNRILTGSREATAADLGALAAVDGGEAFTLPYIDLTGGAKVGAYAAQTGSLGRNQQILALVERDLGLRSPDGVQYPLYSPEPDQRAAIEGYLASRHEAWANKGFTDARSRKKMVDLEGAQERKLKLLEDEQRGLLLDNLSLGGRATLANQATTIVNLMKAGLCHSAAITTERGWDTHDDIDEQNNLYEQLFQGLTVLMNLLQQGGLFDETIVVVISEMTRTPRMNRDGGKDHWPSTSAMVISGGIEGGRVLGGTSRDKLDALPVDLNTGLVDTSLNTRLEYSNFISGVLSVAGVDVATYLPNVPVLQGIG